MSTARRVFWSNAREGWVGIIGCGGGGGAVWREREREFLGASLPAFESFPGCLGKKGGWLVALGHGRRDVRLGCRFFIAGFMGFYAQLG